jgi:hypothetical protein
VNTNNSTVPVAASAPVKKFGSMSFKKVPHLDSGGGPAHQALDAVEPVFVQPPEPIFSQDNRPPTPSIQDVHFALPQSPEVLVGPVTVVPSPMAMKDNVPLMEYDSDPFASFLQPNSDPQCVSSVFDCFWLSSADSR